jgi:glycosyltransferase involved in cell wall biosynthesis
LVTRRLATIGRPRIGVIGRLSHEKGVDLFLESFRLLADRGVRAHAILVGDGPEGERLAAQAATLGLGDSVHFLGAVYPVDPLYSELDLVVIPSRSEGLPNVLLEALHAGRPVVSTDVGAVTEVLADSAAGRVVPPLDPAALAAAMASALADPEGTGAAARRTAADRFSLDRRVTAHVALYRELLGLPASVAHEAVS